MSSKRKSQATVNLQDLNCNEIHSSNNIHRLKRERNNVAVKKSREKTRQKNQETAVKMNALKEENVELESRIDLLSNELVSLKKQLMTKVVGKGCLTRNADIGTFKEKEKNEDPLQIMSLNDKADINNDILLQTNNKSENNSEIGQMGQLIKHVDQNFKVTKLNENYQIKNINKSINNININLENKLLNRADEKNNYDKFNDLKFKNLPNNNQIIIIKNNNQNFETTFNLSYNNNKNLGIAKNIVISSEVNFIMDSKMQDLKKPPNENVIMNVNEVNPIVNINSFTLNPRMEILKGDNNFENTNYNEQIDIFNTSLIMSKYNEKSHSSLTSSEEIEPLFLVENYEDMLSTNFSVSEMNFGNN